VYDLRTIKRLNDAAALRKQFPDHNCADEVTFSPEYESFLDDYVLVSDCDAKVEDLQASVDALTAKVKSHLDHLEWVASDPRESQASREAARFSAREWRDLLSERGLV
jgi:hypothetical protein